MVPNEKPPTLRLVTPDGIAPLGVTIKEAAAVLGYSKRTITRLIHRGELRCFGRGPLTRVSVASIHTYTQRQAAEQGGDDAA